MDLSEHVCNGVIALSLFLVFSPFQIRFSRCSPFLVQSGVPDQHLQLSLWLVTLCNLPKGI